MGTNNIDADILTKYCLWRQIYAGGEYQPHKAISVAIQPTTTEYHNTTYTITSHISKNKIIKYPNIED